MPPFPKIHHKPIFWAPGQVLHKLDDNKMYQIDYLELDSRERFAKAADLDLILILSILLFLHDQLLATYFQLLTPHNSSYK